MINVHFMVGKTPSGKGWKIYAWGQPNGHIMDWNGCNYRIATAGYRQPLRGFTVPHAAVDHLRDHQVTEDQLLQTVERTDGAFLTDARFKQLIGINLDYLDNGSWILNPDTSQREMIKSGALKIPTKYLTVRK